jgi:lipopolysaccharide biosynthesis glycosyltransferase
MTPTPDSPAASSSPVVIACAADRAYAMPLAVMLRSVDAHLAPERPLVVHIADDGIPIGEKARITATLSARCTINWIAARPWQRTSLPTWGRMPLTTYQKLAIGDWLPGELERVIWLDCDLLVLSDLGRLWALPNGDRIALAAQDPLVPRVGSRFGVSAWRELGLAADVSYFNAGVMVIDLGRWRREKVAERAADYFRRFSDRVVFWDQEALNAVLAGQWGELDSRWNRNPVLHRLLATGDEAPDGAPWIAHFSGRLKPWTYAGASEFQATFDSYLDSTPWAGWRPRRSWRRAVLTRYSTSSLRRRLFPLEQWWTAAICRLTRRRVADDRT